jgi:hypothetical protein
VTVCRHDGRMVVHTDSLGTGKITRRREVCEKCGAGWTYVPCPCCGTLVLEDKLAALAANQGSEDSHEAHYGESLSGPGPADQGSEEP